ncbi:MAG TPA: hypothetical protein VFV66_33515 [Nonomuraea sp.]|nr:hypothetical protein [Nonomuraea sp.]
MTHVPGFETPEQPPGRDTVVPEPDLEHDEPASPDSGHSDRPDYAEHMVNDPDLDVDDASG